ncbi:MAG: T9SS type A sorting domain-containing protein, partial [Bacteroidales bacterium]|nr:T9SS type A sorting domain-containing protein [Bacteroidales bacterium]
INATLVLHVQLLMECDFHITYWGLRNGVVMEESDEPMTSHGMDRTKIGEWQKITMILEQGLEGNTFDFSQWAGFNLRDRNNVANFLVDEVYVIYPESSNVGIAPMKQTGTNMHLKNYPNPASDITTIEFTLPQAAPTSLVIYDMLGQKMTSLINKTLSAGDHKISFDVKDYTPGIYVYELRSGNQSQVKKMFINTMF